MRIAVAGGGIAGLAGALVMARRGHQVVLVERDDCAAVDDWRTAFTWTRDGVAHFTHPHAFLPRGTCALRDAFPDVYETLLHAGARELPLWRKLPGGDVLPQDRDLVYLSVRRQLVEWALRLAIRTQEGISVLGATRVRGLLADSGAVPKVRGLLLEPGGSLEADLVIDAMGRTSQMAACLETLGAPPLDTESSDMGILNYSRYFQMLPGRSFPDGPWLVSPRGDLGYAIFSTFLGDNGTFAIFFGSPAFDRELRALRHEEAFMAACRAIPLLATLVDDNFARPVTSVLPMGGLRNTLRRWTSEGSDALSAQGVVPMGDAYCHTDPALALGLSMSLVHPLALADAAAEYRGDVEAVALAYFESTFAETQERFKQSRALDEARDRRFRGEAQDFTKRSGSYPLFALIAGGAAALRDPEVFRRVARRNGFLDPTSALDDDIALQERIESIFASIMAEAPARPSGPARGDLIGLLEEAHSAQS